MKRGVPRLELLGKIFVGAQSSELCSQVRPVSDEALRTPQLSNKFELKADGRVADGCVNAPSKFYGQAERAISTGKLHALLRFNILPINQVVYLGPS